MFLNVLQIIVISVLDPPGIGSRQALTRLSHEEKEEEEEEEEEVSSNVNIRESNSRDLFEFC